MNRLISLLQLIAGLDDELLYKRQLSAIDDAIEETIKNFTAITFIEEDKKRPNFYWPRIIDWFK